MPFQKVQLVPVSRIPNGIYSQSALVVAWHVSGGRVTESALDVPVALVILSTLRST